MNQNDCPMTKKIYLLMSLVVFGFGSIFSQDEKRDDTWISVEVTDEMTVNADQNAKWRTGEYKYSAKPKDAWELGFHLGHFVIDGDVDRKIPAGYGLGLHLRKAIYYAFSIRFDLFYGQAKGLDPQAWLHKSYGGGLVEDTFAPYNNSNRNNAYWFPSHKTRYIYGAVQGVLNIGNLLFHNERNKWNWYLSAGIGLDNHQAKLDLLDANGNPYTNLISATGFGTANDFDTKEGRDNIKQALESIYDGDYETEGYKKKGIFRLGDDTNIHFVWTASVGVSRKISKRFNIGLEHQVMLSDNDYLDGIKFRSAVDQTNNVDVGHYTNFRFSFNLGDFSKRTEPLYWLNPLDASFSDIANLKLRVEFDPSDDDSDGVINILDIELNTEAGCPVDTRGKSLDSDGDGCIDCKDAEPFSPPGYDMVDCVAQVPPPPTMTKTEVINIMNENCPGCKDKCGEWFLPMINFDLDKYYIKPEFYGHLHHVATVMKQCPNLCVVAHGHTDVRNSNAYNMVLSYNRAKAAIDYLVSNYGIDRDRIKLMYGGEESPMVPGLPDHHNISKDIESKQYMNRRVEFRVCAAGDYDMERPEGPEAGEGSTGSSRVGSKYSGNKSSGY
jgi:hypothetical protein